MAPKRGLTLLVALAVVAAIIVIYIRRSSPPVSSIPAVEPATRSKEVALMPAPPADRIVGIHHSPKDSRNDEVDSAESNKVTERILTESDVTETNVITVNEIEATVPGAEVFLRKPQDWQALGRTNDDGVLACEIADGTNRQLVVRARGHALCTVAVPDEVPPEFVVKLHRGDSIAGRVEYADRTPGPGGVTVYVTPADSFVSAMDVALLRREFPTILFDVTDDGGHFEVENLDPDVPYQVFAAGRGVVTEKGHRFHGEKFLHPVSPGESDLRIVVGVLLGAVLEMVEETGRAIETSKDLSSPTAISQIPSMHSFYDPNTPILDLAGVKSQCVQLDKPNVKFFFYVLESAFVNVDPIRVDLNIPGYERASITLDLAPVADGLSYQRGVLKRRTDGFGTLRASFRGFVPIELGQIETMLGGVGSLSFVGERGEEEFSCNISLQENPCIVEGIPYGDYEVIFTPHPGFVRLKPERESDSFVRIYDDHTLADLGFDLSALGAIKFRVVDRSSGDESVNTASVRVQNSETGRTRNMVFYRAPYFLGLLPPGKYEAQYFESIRGPGGPLPVAPVLVEVQAGSVSEATIFK